MAKLDDLLTGLLLRRLKTRGEGTPISPLETKTLTGLAGSQQTLIQRLKDTAKKRRVIHHALKRQHQELKQEFRDMKEQARVAVKEAKDRELENDILKREVTALQEAVAEKLALPAMHPLPSDESRKDWAEFIKNRVQVWRYPMRLGVLRQHEPKPLEREVFPQVSLPGAPETWPLISISTPSYQQAHFLERTLKSVLDQDYPRIEYHVRDGGSVDGSVELLKQYESRLASWASEKDSGAASAINRGFASSTGEIMAWINSDDLFVPGAFRHVADYFAKHPEVDAVYGHRYIIDERDWQVARWTMPRHDPEMILWGDYIPQETLFWRRSLWNKVGGQLDETFKFAFDWDLLLRFHKAGAKIVRLPYFLGCFRVHDAQKSSAEIGTVGMNEMARLRERELGDQFTKLQLSRRTILYQRKAIWVDRLLRRGIRW
jgi:glycosyltransferase involved in cell wall biosynthesis/regulator of replication initiation timing